MVGLHTTCCKMEALQWKLWWLVCWETFAASSSQPGRCHWDDGHTAPGTSGRMVPEIFRAEISGPWDADVGFRSILWGLEFWRGLIWINCIFGGRIILRGFDGSVPTAQVFPAQPQLLSQTWARSCVQRSSGCFFRITWIAGCCIILLYQVILIGWNSLLPHRFGWFILIYGMFMLCGLAFLKMLRERHHMSSHGRAWNVSFSQTFWMFISPTLGSEVMGVPPSHPKSSKILLFQVLKPMVVGYPGIPILGNPQLVYRIL